MTSPEEIAREIVDKWWGLPDYIRVPPVQYEQLVDKIAAALAASEQRKCHNCNDEPATQCAKCLHAAEDALHASEQRVRELEKECAIEAKQFVDMKSYADCVEIKLQASERALEIARKEIVALSAENGRLRIIALASPGSPQ